MNDLTVIPYDHNIQFASFDISSMHSKIPTTDLMVTLRKLCEVNRVNDRTTQDIMRIAYQSSKSLCIHLSHLVSQWTSSSHLALSSCYDVAGCLLHGLSFNNSWPFFNLWHHSNTTHFPKHVKLFSFTFLRQSFMVGCCSRWSISLLTSLISWWQLHNTTVSEKEHMPSQAEARLSCPVMMLLCSLAARYFAVSYNVL